MSPSEAAGQQLTPSHIVTHPDIIIINHQHMRLRERNVYLDLTQLPAVELLLCCRDAAALLFSLHSFSFFCR